MFIKHSGYLLRSSKPNPDLKSKKKNQDSYLEQTVHYKSLSPSASFNRLLETVTHQSRIVGLPHWSTRSA